MVYKEAIQATSTAESPWLVMPADHKWYSRLDVSEMIARIMESIDMKYPDVSEEHLKSLAEAKILLENEPAR